MKPRAKKPLPAPGSPGRGGGPGAGGGASATRRVARADRAARRCRSGCLFRTRRASRCHRVQVQAVRLSERALVAVRGGEVRHHPGTLGEVAPPSSTSLWSRGTAPARATRAGGSPRSPSGQTRSRAGDRAAGLREHAWSALPIARVTVTWPATIRSSGTPAISTVASGSSAEVVRATIAPRRSSVGFTHPVLDRRDAVPLKLHVPACVPAAPRGAASCWRSSQSLPQRWICSRSARGNPNSSPNTRSGSGQANASTMSACPRGAALDQLGAISWIRGSSAPTRRGVKARATSPRIRSWMAGRLDDVRHVGVARPRARRAPRGERGGPRT